MEQQRREVRRFAEAFDAADENGVIASRVFGDLGHFEARAAARKDRGAADAGVPRQAGKAVGRPGGEAIRQILLIGGQHIDGVVAGLAEGGQVVRLVVEAPEDERRLERDGGEGIDGQADGVAVRVDGRDDGDAGGIAAEGVAQGAAVVLRLGHRAGPVGRKKKRPYYPCSRSPRRGRIWPSKTVLPKT